MDHPLLIKIDDLDTAIGNSADLTACQAAELGHMLGQMRKYVVEALDGDAIYVTIKRDDLRSRGGDAAERV